MIYVSIDSKNVYLANDAPPEAQTEATPDAQVEQKLEPKAKPQSKPKATIVEQLSTSHNDKSKIEPTPKA